MTDTRPRIDLLDRHTPMIDAVTPEHHDRIVALGGDLSPARVRMAYARGIFPWGRMASGPLWWCPSPRAVFATATTRPNTRARRMLRAQDWHLDVDQAFDQVIAACAAPRPNQAKDAAWLTPEVVAVFRRLHREGDAHSFEIWEGDALVGGLYGIAAGGIFSAESMFSRRANASKAALWEACRILSSWGVPWMDVQMANPHTQSLGVVHLDRPAFLEAVRRPRVWPADWRAALPPEDGWLRRRTPHPNTAPSVPVHPQPARPHAAHVT